MHHQNDVGEASYAAVPIIARIADTSSKPTFDPFALAAVIELCRRKKQNPELPAWLVEDYASAWDQLFRTAHRLLLQTEDDSLVQSLLAVVAIRKGLPRLGEISLDFTEDERGMMLVDFGVGQD